MSQNNKNYFLLLYIVISPLLVFSQAKERVLPGNINRQSINNYAPYMSGDGNFMVYLNDNNDFEELRMVQATKKTAASWNDPVEIAKPINFPKLNYTGGYSLSFDGKTLYFTSRRSGGIGGYDIWYSTKTSTGWSQPTNDGTPLNTYGHEGCPVLSPDGQYMYFMRCETMSQNSADQCKLFVAKRKRNSKQWTEAVELPANINDGNTMTPRIMADGETLMFASSKPGGKGGLDLYMTRKEGDSWSDPVPLDFINSEENEQYIAVTAKGRYMFYDRRGAKNRQIAGLLIPDEFKPEKLMRIEGKVVDAGTGEPLEAYIRVYNLDTRERIWNLATDNQGDFNLTLKEGANYDLAIEPRDPNYKFYSKLYELEEMRFAGRDEFEATLNTVNSGDQFVLDGIQFKPFTAELDDKSTYELRRLTRMVRNYADNRFEIAAYIDEFKTDSIQSDPDLTEVIIDTLIIEPEVIEYDSLNEISELDADSLAYEEEEVYDSLAIESSPEPAYTLKYTYHNDRTQKQAQAVVDYLVSRGIPAENIVAVGYKDNHKLVENDSDANRSKNRRIEIKVLE
ncbi:MAG: hypothetical protein AAFX87_06445 [Bacteroidota bacterium]